MTWVFLCRAAARRRACLTIREKGPATSAGPTNRRRIAALAALAFTTTAFAQTTVETAPAPEKPKPSFMAQFKDPEDGAFDMTQFILSKHGFLAVPIVITDPAVGYGGGAALLFLKYAPDPPPGAPRPKRYVPPSIPLAAGGMTDHGTRSRAP